ncbi:response regulator [Escherichia coli]
MIVLDIMLPGMDGWQILTNVKEQQSKPLLFAFTARGILSMTESERLDSGANDYLVKPFSIF